MTNKHEWPVQVPTTGAAINEIDEHLKSCKHNTIEIDREQLEQWQSCLIYCAALLDPDNPPSTPEQLARMKRR